MRKEKNSCILSLLLLGIGIFNIMDYFLTLHVIAQGHEEANPLVNAIQHTVYFPIVKLMIIPFLLLFMWPVRQYLYKRLMPLVWIVFLSYFSLMIYFRVVFL